MRHNRRFLCWKGSELIGALSLAIAIAIGMAPSQSRAQTAEGAAAQEATDEAEETSTDEITQLVAPVALYPDPIFALVLQASTQPLDVVQAHRFLEQRAKDPSLTPDPDLDSSVLGLMNYPGTLKQMNEYLDWTEELGNAVVDRLEDVQAAILDIRWSAYNTGILASNDRQNVVADGDVIRIQPADAKTVSVPQYDPNALLAAIEPSAELVEETAEEIEEETVEEAVPAQEAQAEPQEPPAPQTQAAAAPQEASAAAEPMAPAPPPPSTYYPQYAGPPVVSYGEPESGFWDDAATFAGGAVVGGLLGWGLTEAFDDDDDDDNNGGGRRVNIEDSTIVVGGDRIDSDRIQKELRDRRGEGGDNRLSKKEKEDLRDRAKGVAPANYKKPDRAGPGDVKRKRDVKLPGGGTLSKKRAKTAAAGRTRDKAGRGLAASKGKRSQVAKEKARGKASRQAAKRTAGSAKSAPAPRGGKSRDVKKAKGGGGMGANVKDGGKAKKYAARGKSSRQRGKKKRKRT